MTRRYTQLPAMKPTKADNWELKPSESFNSCYSKVGSFVDNTRNHEKIGTHVLFLTVLVFIP